MYAAARRPLDGDDARVVPLELDVSDEASVSAAASASDVTVVVNNAGLLRRGGLVDGPLEDIRTQVETNLIGPLLVTRAFAPALRAAHGMVVNVASVFSWLGGSGAYGVSKAGLWSVTDSTRLELAGDGVQVVGAYLGYTDTPMTDGVDAPKNTPEDVVTAVYDGVEQGEHEVLADEQTRSVRASLGAPVSERYTGLVG